MNPGHDTPKPGLVPDKVVDRTAAIEPVITAASVSSEPDFSIPADAIVPGPDGLVELVTEPDDLFDDDLSDDDELTCVPLDECNAMASELLAIGFKSCRPIYLEQQKEAFLLKVGDRKKTEIMVWFSASAKGGFNIFTLKDNQMGRSIGEDDDGGPVSSGSGAILRVKSWLVDIKEERLEQQKLVPSDEAVLAAMKSHSEVDITHGVPKGYTLLKTKELEKLLKECGDPVRSGRMVYLAKNAGCKDFCPAVSRTAPHRGYQMIDGWHIPEGRIKPRGYLVPDKAASIIRGVPAKVNAGVEKPSTPARVSRLFQIKQAGEAGDMAALRKWAEGDAKSQLQVVAAVGQHAEGFDLLKDLATSRYPSVRDAAVVLLGRRKAVDGGKALELLIRLAKPGNGVVTYAVSSLAKLPGGRAVLEAWGKRYGTVPERALGALARATLVEIDTLAEIKRAVEASDWETLKRIAAPAQWRSDYETVVIRAIGQNPEGATALEEIAAAVRKHESDIRSRW